MQSDLIEAVCPAGALAAFADQNDGAPSEVIEADSSCSRGMLTVPGM